MSINKVILLGRLGKDPELKYASNGNAVCNFSLATSESWKDKRGEWQEKTEWHNVVVWGRPGEAAANILTKGALCSVEGKITTRKWQDQSGNTRYMTEIVADRWQIEERKRDAGQDAPADYYPKQHPQHDATTHRRPEPAVDRVAKAFDATTMDEVPF